MAVNQNLQCVTLTCGSDAVTQYNVVTLSADNTVQHADTDDILIGIAQNSATEGQAVTVAINGISKCNAGDTIARSALVAADNGQAESATVETTIAAGTATMTRSIGRALEGAVSGDVFEILIMPQEFIKDIS